MKRTTNLTYERALSYLHSAPRFPRTPGLDRMRRLMAALGDPQDRLQFLHIAGTNGKGSVAAMTASILYAAGYRTGCFTSPYLEVFEERIQVNGEPIEQAALCRHTAQVQAAAERLRRSDVFTTEFELVTALGFLYFAEQRCDIVVLETGLGGRFDATNVIPPPLGAAITSISKDHTGVLGDTLSQIAWEKCGILKPGSRGVTASTQPPEALSAIRNAAVEGDVPLSVVTPPPMSRCKTGLTGTVFPWQGEVYHLPLLGLHQVENAVLALELADFVSQSGRTVSGAAKVRGLAEAVWPGRLEVLSRAPMILLDSAHNPGGIASLLRALETYFPGKPVHTVMGMLADKDYAACAAALAERSVRFYATQPPVAGRAVPAAEFGRAAAPFCNDVRMEPSLEKALDKALDVLPAGHLLVVCGSIPLVGQARTWLRHHLETGSTLWGQE